MSQSNYNLLEGLGYTGVYSLNCLPAALDTIAERDIKLSTYRDYEQLMITFDSIPQDERDKQISIMNKAMAKDLGCKASEWFFARVVTVGGLSRSLTRLDRLNMLPVIDVIHPEMIDVDDQGYLLTHALGVKVLGKDSYKLSGSWVPENMMGEQTADTIFPYLAQSPLSPNIPRSSHPMPYYGANISSLPRRY